jgi:hypothetical protein
MDAGLLPELQDAMRQFRLIERDERHAYALEKSDGQMSSTKARVLLGAQRHQDVSHIIPRSLGGADHIDNYILTDRSVNISFGNRDYWYFAGLAGFEKTKRAVALSPNYRGPCAEELMRQAKKMHVQMI